MIEIFTGPGCAYCSRAKELLAREGAEFIEHDLGEDPAHLAEFRRRLPRTRAIPQIFVDGEHLGSYEDLMSLRSRGELRVRLGL